MSHQNFQEAIEQISTDENTFLNPEEIKTKFDLNEEDMMAMKTYNPLMQTMTPPVTNLCCCCWQSDN